MSPPKESGWRYVQWARTQRVGDGSAKAVLNALATYANWRTGACVVGQETLAEHTEKGVSTVRAALRKLEEEGFITRRGRGAQGRRLADEITLTPGPHNPLPLDAGASERSTTAKTQRTTARNQGPLPPESGGVTLHSEHALRNTPSGRASRMIGGLGPEFLPALPDGPQVKAAATALQEFNLYGTGGLSTEDMWIKFREHAQRTDRRVANIDKAWSAWVRGAIQIERERLGVVPRRSAEHVRAD